MIAAFSQWSVFSLPAGEDRTQFAYDHTKGCVLWYRLATNIQILENL